MNERIRQARADDRREVGHARRSGPVADDTTVGLPALCTDLPGWRRHVGPRVEAGDGLELQTG